MSQHARSRNKERTSRLQHGTDWICGMNKTHQDRYLTIANGIKEEDFDYLESNILRVNDFSKIETITYQSTN